MLLGLDVEHQLVADLEPYEDRNIDQIAGIVVHRSGPWPGNKPKNAADVALRFTTVKETGGLMPYHLVLNPETLRAYQALPLTKIGPHARLYNKSTVGVAVLGDWRHENLSVPQFLWVEKQLRRLHRLISLMHVQPGIFVMGHTDLKGASSDPDKVCPGPGLYLEMMDL